MIFEAQLKRQGRLRLALLLLMDAGAATIVAAVE